MSRVSHFKVQMFGGLLVRFDEVVVSDLLHRSKKAQSLLAYLLIERRRIVPIEELYELFWPGASNPQNALKTLVHRLRSMLIQGGVPSEIACIQQKQGGYQWNPSLDTEIDVERFEIAFQRLQEEKLDCADRVTLLEETLLLYQGHFLNKSILWISSVGSYLQNCYRSMTLQLCALYREENRAEDAVAVSRTALCFDPLDEEIAQVVISSLLACGRYAEALEEYQTITELCYSELCVQPSEELRALYRKITTIKKKIELDIDSVCEQLEEKGGSSGAYVCEYSIFQDLYHIEARCLERYGGRVFLGLITITDAYLQPPPPSLLKRTMGQLLEVTRVCLRRGDIISRFSPAQYVLLLPTVTYETGYLVMERIRGQFRRRYPKAPVVLTCKLRPLRYLKEDDTGDITVIE